MSTPHNTQPGVDAAEEAASASSLALAPAVEAIARTLRQNHMDQRLAEAPEASRSKVWKWDMLKVKPRQGRHKS